MLENQELIHRYRNDPMFHRLVDILADVLIKGQFSPEEIGQAVSVAMEKYTEHQKQNIY